MRELILAPVVLAAVAVFSLSAAGAEIVFQEGLEYANPDGQHLQLNLARPKDPGPPRPAVLCIHGGGFRAGKRERWDTLCRQLAERGYVAATASYRLAPRFQFPAAVHDVKAAVRWLRAHAAQYGIDSTRIGAVGDSAGGHLAQFLGVTAGVREFEGDGGNAEQSSAVACVVNYYGPSDFSKSYGKSVDAAEVLPLLLGGDLEHARRQHIVASPLYWVTPDAAPTLLLHGTKDPYVAFEQATWIRDRLRAAEVEVELLGLEGAGHGFKGTDAERAVAAMFAFFDKQLKRPTMRRLARHAGPACLAGLVRRRVPGGRAAAAVRVSLGQLLRLVPEGPRRLARRGAGARRRAVADLGFVRRRAGTGDPGRRRHHAPLGLPALPRS